MTATETERVPTACVIGAGPAGLAAGAALSAAGIDCEILEHHRRLGGIWAAERPMSPVWSGTKFISPAGIAGFPGAPMPGSGYPTASEVGAYLEAFAATHHLHGLIRPSTTVRSLTPSGKGWDVEAAGMRRHYDTVLLASGQHWVPQVPAGAGSFAGQGLHSSAYRGAAPFADQRVLVVGGGNSAGDVASDLASTAATVTLSVRRGFYIVPRWIDRQPTAEWVQGPVGAPGRLVALVQERQRQLHALGMPWPQGALFESNPVVNDRLGPLLADRQVLLRPEAVGWQGRSVQFCDGRQENFDTVIFATGFRPGRLVRAVVGPGYDRPDLIAGMISPVWDGLFLLGLFAADGPTFPLLARQADVAARVIALRRQGTDRTELEALTGPAAAIDPRAGRHYSTAARNYAAVSWQGYTQQLQALAAALDAAGNAPSHRRAAPAGPPVAQAAGDPAGYPARQPTHPTAQRCR